MNVGLDEDQTNFELFDTLTFKPKKIDKILGVMAVCAPYATLLKYKYKVKLTPGTMKRGKCLKTIIELFKS